jgi:hypothetical protein
MLGPGEMGKPFMLEGRAKAQGQADMTKWFMNVAASDRISLDRRYFYRFNVNIS